MFKIVFSILVYWRIKRYILVYLQEGHLINIIITVILLALNIMIRLNYHYDGIKSPYLSHYTL